MVQPDVTGERRPTNEVNPTDIAVVGMAGRFPGAGDLATFWRNLETGADCLTRFRDEELIAAGVDPVQLRGPEYVKARGVLADVELFDAGFFGVTPRDARLMDPQHRLLLECAHQALEDAGCDPGRHDGSIGLFAGAGAPTYLLSNLVPNRKVLASVSLHDLLLTNEADHLTTRVAYKLDLRGPAVTVLTTCSTSLVATCLAAQSLLSYHSDVALAGGVTVTVPQETGYTAQRGLLSPDGRVRPFDAAAGGVVSGSGVGVVVLKRLAEALEDGDCVRAVIKGFALNNDGSDKIGYTAPSVTGHMEAVATAQAMADVGPETIDFVEAHGTATELGDPIEVDALRRAFRGVETGRCALGSVKGNIGHADAAAGVASLIKTVLALENRRIPPCPHFQAPNPKLELDGSPFYVNPEAVPWERRTGPRRGAVSSLGLGGTNAHVILEEAPEPVPSGPSRPWQLLTVSARSARAVGAAASALATHLRNHQDLPLADVAFTRHLGRRQLEHRRAVVCRSTEDAADLLEDVDSPWVLEGRAEHRRRPVAFLLSGVGAGRPGITGELYRTERSFREAVDRCAEILEPELQGDIRRTLYPGGEWGPDPLPESAASASAACFVVDYALAVLWRSWGVEPEALLGHSTGEYVAACLAGVFSLEDALGAVALRGRLGDSVPPGQMLSVAMDSAGLEELLPPEVSIAAHNAPTLAVVSGPREQVSALAAELRELGVESRDLGISRAGHSAMLEPVLDELLAHLVTRELRAPEIPFVSNVTGNWITAEEATDPAYWVRHFRRTVRFSQGVQRLLEPAGRAVLEVGGGRTLASLAAKHTRETGPRVIVSSLGDRGLDDAPATAQVLAALGRLWLAGVDPDWTAFYAGQRRSRVPLPTYPFERRRFWIDPPSGSRLSPYGSGLVAGADGGRAPVEERTWRRSATPRLRPSAEAGGASGWLLLAPSSSIARPVAAGLEAAGRPVEVACWEAAAPSAQGSKGPSAALFGRLLGGAAARGGMPEEIVLLVPRGFGGAPAEDGGASGVRTLLALTEALERQPLEPSARLWVVSEGLLPVDGREEVDAAEAFLAGACEALAAGPAPVRVRHLDVSPGEGDWSGWLAERLLAEAGLDEPVVAYRNGLRWTRCSEPVAAGPVRANDLFGSAHWSLLAGPLDRVTGTLAPALAELGIRRFAAFDPDGVPPRDQWEAWSAGDPPGELVEPAVPQPVATGFDGADLVREVHRLEGAVAAEIELAEYPMDLERGLDALSAAYVHRYLRGAGLDTGVGRAYGREELRKELGIVDELAKFYDFFLQVLHEDGFLELDRDRLEFLRPPDEMPDPEALRDDLARSYPEYATELDVVAHCVEHYPQALTGAIDKTSVLFPDGRTDISAPVVENWRRHSNAAIYLRAIAELLEGLAGGGPLRILEAGGGNGILTWEAAPRLAGKVAEYCFTDIGRTFVRNAQKRAEADGLDFMSFRPLDISRDPAGQGVERHAWDVVLAFNVVHATPDVRATLGHLRSLLRPGGLLLLLESARQRRSSTMVGGLAEGWWYFEDHDIRPHSPLMSHERWEEVLAAEGFHTARVFPGSGPGRQRADHAFVLLQEASPIETASYREWRARRTAEAVERIRLKIGTVRSLEERGAEVVLAQDPAGAVDRAGGPERIAAVVHVADADGDRAASGGSRCVLQRLEREAQRFGALSAAVAGAQPELRLAVVPGGRSGALVHRAVAAFVEARGAAGEGWSTVEWTLGGDVPAAAAALQRLLSFEAPGNFAVTPGEEDVSWSREADLAEDEGPGDGFVAPTTETEKVTARIWAEVFGMSRVGLHDDFFDLGGESLLATQLVSRLRSALGVELSIRSFYENPTVAAIAELAAAAKPAPAERGETDRITRAPREAFRARRSAEGSLQIEEPAPVAPEKGSG